MFSNTKIRWRRALCICRPMKRTILFCAPVRPPSLWSTLDIDDSVGRIHGIYPGVAAKLRSPRFVVLPPSFSVQAEGSTPRRPTSVVLNGYRTIGIHSYLWFYRTKTLLFRYLHPLHVHEGASLGPLHSVNDDDPMADGL